MSSGSINVTGTYAMLTTGTPACLQFMSDAVVNATYVIVAFSRSKLRHPLCMYHLAVPNQTIPDWVQHLPEPERSEKIAYIKQYGSPNVFTQFQPHVTLACDANATALSAAFAQKAPQVQGGWLPAAVALGPTGPCGTVCCLYLCVYNVRCCFKIC
jgi:hypothetical protein